MNVLKPPAPAKARRTHYFACRALDNHSLFQYESCSATSCSSHTHHSTCTPCGFLALVLFVCRRHQFTWQWAMDEVLRKQLAPDRAYAKLHPM